MREAETETSVKFFSNFPAYRYLSDRDGRANLGGESLWAIAFSEIEPML